MNLYPTGEVDVERTAWPGGGVTYHVQWVSDSSGVVRGWLEGAFGAFDCIETRPGQAAPTDNYDIVLNRGDTNGADMMGGNLANRDTSTTEEAYPATGTPILDTNIFFSLSGNSVNNATGTVTIYVYK